MRHTPQGRPHPSVRPRFSHQIRAALKQWGMAGVRCSSGTARFTDKNGGRWNMQCGSIETLLRKQHNDGMESLPYGSVCHTKDPEQRLKAAEMLIDQHCQKKEEET